MSWIDLPDKPIKYTQQLESQDLAELQELLVFVKDEQEEVTLDMLIEMMLVDYVKRKARVIPVQYELEKVSFVLPSSLLERMEEVLKKSQEKNEDAQMSDLVRHAIRVYLASKKELMRAFRAHARASASPEAAKVEPGEHRLIDTKEVVTSSSSREPSEVKDVDSLKADIAKSPGSSPGRDVLERMKSKYVGDAPHDSARASADEGSTL